ncbi:site-specific integrase [Clostridium sp. WB02_MRS01]|nr:site-specific integrase [Clostridium sp. WB02_MRS01]
MRKTFASRLNANGVPIDEIRTLLGHADAQTT